MRRREDKGPMREEAMRQLSQSGGERLGLMGQGNGPRNGRNPMWEKVGAAGRHLQSIHKKEDLSAHRPTCPSVSAIWGERGDGLD